MAKNKRVTYITPAGEAVWPKLDKVDVFTPKKGAPKIRYTLNIKWDDKTLAKVQKDIDALIKEHKMDVGDNENSPFKTDKEGGVTLFAFSGKDKKPPVFDAKNRRLPDSVIVGGGSKIRADLTLNPYDGFGGGMSFYINAVQVLELVEKQYGPKFEEVEDGFEYEGSEDAPAESFGSDKASIMDDEIPF